MHVCAEVTRSGDVRAQQPLETGEGSLHQSDEEEGQAEGTHQVRHKQVNLTGKRHRGQNSKKEEEIINEAT